MNRILVALGIVSILYSCNNKTEEKKQKEDIFKINVETQEIKKEKFQHVLELSGSIEAENIAYISPQTNGQIKTIHVKEGQRVKSGQLLVTINTEVLSSSLEELRTAYELALTMYKKQKELWEKKIGSEVQYLQAKNAKESLDKKIETLKAQLELSKIRAPFDGIVDEIYQKEGELAMPGMQIIQFVNLNNMLLDVDVSESYISKISDKDMVLVSIPSLELEKQAKIYRLGNVINEQNRTFKLQVKLDNKKELIKPNMVALINIIDFSCDSAIIIPSEIIKKDTRNKMFVFIISKENNDIIAKKVFVEPGMSYKGKTMVINGLSENDIVIIKGYNKVSNGSVVDIKESKK